MSDGIPHALTYDDCLLLPGESRVLPKEVDVTTQLTPKIRLSIPLVSAAMDTVTEGPAAIALAQSGGIGVIHRNGTIEEQSSEVARVKKSESGMVVAPITVSPDQPLAEVAQLRERHGISGFLVTRNGKLAGILSRRDVRFAEDFSKPVRDFMTPREKLITAKEGIRLEEARQLLKKHRVEKLPVIDNQDNLKGLITIKDLEKSIQYPGATKDDFGRLRVAAAIGTGPLEIERAGALLEAGVDCVVIDTAHGHSHTVRDTLRSCLKNFPKAEFIAGNVATEEGGRFLIEAGVHGVKVGIGPGSICTTRVVAGIGVPQLSAVQWVCQAAATTGIPVIADGGIKFSGDIVKALAAGAKTVMIGSLFAGTDEAPGEVVLYQGRSYKVYRGMGSLSAMQRGSKERYFQHEVPLHKLVPEGIEGRVPYRGKLTEVIHQLVGGLRSGLGYVGAADLEELRKKARFVRMTPSGLKESHVHDVIITQEAPNYRME